MITDKTSEEQKEAAIDRYVDLMRINAYETGENKELDYQIKVAKVKLSSFGIDYSELELKVTEKYQTDRHAGQLYRNTLL